ncbi:hypothetical protein L484_018358 [Morus notabilis]|uniref:ACT domain-containing protein ACR n=1 Tax=Morus notabilis TaxID=981085 RepID=W9QRG0_9ROSA|nr:hypothetical protein L484_018358 [Morus notabilis]
MAFANTPFFASSFSAARRPRIADSDHPVPLQLAPCEPFNVAPFHQNCSQPARAFSRARTVVQASSNGLNAVGSTPLKSEQDADYVPMPIVMIDQDSDSDATIVQLSFGDRLGALIDTMRALKDLGLDVSKGTVATEGSVKQTKIYITRLDSGRKVEDPDMLERIRLTIINNLLKYHPESSQQLAMGEAFGIKAPEKKIKAANKNGEEERKYLLVLLHRAVLLLLCSKMGLGFRQSKLDWNRGASTSHVEQSYVRSHVILKIGNGRRVRFWEDEWAGEESLAASFSNLFRLSNLHNQAISSFYSIGNDATISWNFHFRRNPSERELGEVVGLLSCLEGVRVCVALEDRWVWDLEGSGIFSCKSLFNSLVDNQSFPPFPFYYFVWKISVPTKILGFWLVTFTLEIEYARYVAKEEAFPLYFSGWCMLCRNENETSDHLFLHCSFALKIWHKILGEFWLQWVFRRSIPDLMGLDVSAGWNKKVSRLWNIIILASLWALWLERNNRTFEGVEGKICELDVDVATHIHVKEDGPKRSLLYIETADRSGLLVEIIKIIADVNIDVESAEIDTEGLIAKDKFHVSYRGAALTSSLSQVVGFPICVIVL